MNQKLFPFGDTRTADVIAVAEGRSPREPKMVTLGDNQGEGHVIAGVEHEIAPAVGMNVELVFTPGGPMNGFWRITRELGPAEKFTFFWRKESPFSQWHPCRFTIDGVTYNCGEQYMMARKAQLFDDHRSLAAIMATSDPYVMKTRGRAVRGFRGERWDPLAPHVVYVANLAKFGQNANLLEALRATEGTTLVEASPSDRIWGIGLRETDPAAQSRSTWRGANKLGEVLTRLRNKLCLTPVSTGTNDNAQR